MKLLTGAFIALFSLGAFSTEYIVKLRDGGDKSMASLKRFGEIRNLNVSVGNFAVLKTDMKMNKIVDQNIEYIEENITYTLSSTPQDQLYNKQWGLKNTGRNSGSIFFPGKKGVDIDAESAWQITKGDEDIKIAVIDTGVDYTHKDLAANIMINEGEIPGNGIDDDGNGFVDDVYGYNFAEDNGDPIDRHGHGTHVAGVIGAVHDEFGIAGIMDKVQILPIKFLGDNGSGTLDAAIRAIDYAISRGVHVMNNSWGGGPYMRSLHEVIEKANEAGIVFVAAAGNSRSDNDARPSYPASYEVDNVISVGALDGSGRKASFSNYGKNSVHVFAPGVDIYSSVTNNKHQKMSGTSMAAPHVAGIVGLLLSVEPHRTPLEVRERALESTHGDDVLSDYAQSGYLSASKILE